MLTIKEAHLVYGWKVRGQTSVYAKNVTVDYGSKREKVKGLVEVFPAVGVAVLFIDFVEEAVHHSDVATLVVAS